MVMQDIKSNPRGSNYSAFLSRKSQHGSDHGIDPVWMPTFLFDFQKALLTWALRRGRAAIFADCGLGKTPMQLAWASNMARHTKGRVLILTPLAVANQTIREANKFNIDAARSLVGVLPSAQIVIANYERLHYFKPEDFSAVVCDESSMLKSFNGKRRAEVTEFMRCIPYRLLCTATAAPNDYIELGTSSEAIGELGYMDMLNRFFKNDQNTSDTGRSGYKKHEAPKWRFKGHAETPFWKWVCSWARACRKPSDLGFSDEGFVLPELIEREHVVQTRTLAEGMLFALPATNIHEEREERRRTIQERCEKAGELVDDTEKSAVVWCHLNDEGDMLEEIIPDCRQIAGSTPDDEKEELYEAFGVGQLRVLAIKDKIGAWGLNWQHCHHVVRFATHSYEGHYQAVRRCWRFGQKYPVVVDLIASEGEVGVKENLQRKSVNADRMFTELVAHMNDAMRVDGVNYDKAPEVPSWLS